MRQPHPRDMAAVISTLRREGAALWEEVAIPGEFNEWRRNVRAAARKADLRISVRRIHGLVLVDHLDHVVGDDEMEAAARAMSGVLTGKPTLTFDGALKDARRERFSVVRNDEVSSSPAL